MSYNLPSFEPATCSCQRREDVSCYNMSMGGCMSLRLSLVWVRVLVAPMVLFGCQGDSEASTDEPGSTFECDPFEAKPLPIKLGKLIGAGNDAQGTLYVADEFAGMGRVFVSMGDALIRQRVSGTGQVGSDFWVLSVADHDPPFDLEVQGTYPASARMGVLEVIGEKTSKTFEIGAAGTELTIVPESEVKRLSLRNLPGDVVLEYAAMLADDQVMVVTRPRDDWNDYQDVHLYLGPTEHVLERRVQMFARGGFTHIDFELDGRAAQAYFPDSFSSLDMSAKPTLTVDHGTREMTLLDDRPGNATYECLPR